MRTFAESSLQEKLEKVNIVVVKGNSTRTGVEQGNDLRPVFRG